MAVKARLRKIGTSLGVIIPKEKLDEIRAKEGDIIIIPRIEKPVREIRGILKGTTFHFGREHADRDETIEKLFKNEAEQH